MLNKFSKSSIFIFLVVFAIIVTVIFVKLLNNNEVVETAEDGSMTAAVLDTEASLMTPSVSDTPTYTPESPTMTPTLEATELPAQELSATQAEDVDSGENTSLVFLVQDDGNLVRVDLNGENEVMVLSQVSGESEFLPFDISSSGDMIVLSKEQDGSQDIFLINAEGENMLNLTEDDLQNYSPRFSPDDKKIAFSGLVGQTYDVSVTDLEGAVLNNFELNTCRPDLAWLDNENLLFVACNHAYDINILNLESGEIFALTADDGDEIVPAVSKNGEQVAFRCRVSANDDFEICVLDMASREIRHLTDNEVDERSVSWSADGSLIIYTTQDGIFAMDAMGNESNDLSSLAIMGGNPIYWNLPNGVASPDSQDGAAFSEMINRDCLTCHVTVPQTHMERTIIISQYSCHDCHSNLEEIHADN